jgi:hypothetical protein
VSQRGSIQKPIPSDHAPLVIDNSGTPFDYVCEGYFSNFGNAAFI